MGEPLSLATNMLKLIANAFTASKEVYSAVEAIYNAPNHIKSISSDLEDFYSILGSLKGYLEDVDMSNGVLQAAEKVNIASVIENCLHIFARISLLVNSYNPRGRRGGIGDMGSWRKFKYSFRIAETEALRSQLAAHKMTLNVAISLVNFININTANINAQRVEGEITNHMRELEEKLPILSRCLEDVAVDALPRPENHSRGDRDQLLVDYNFTVRRYLDCASSTISQAGMPDTASMQVSSLGATDTNGSAYISFYETAKTHISEVLALTVLMEANEDEVECTKVFVMGPYDRTTGLDVDSSLTIGDMLRQLGNGVVGSNVFCTYGGKVLDEAHQLRHYKIPHNATIFCKLRNDDHSWKDVFETARREDEIVPQIVRPWRDVVEAKRPTEEALSQTKQPVSAIFVKIFTGKRINVPLKEIEIDSSIRYLRQLIQDKVGISIDQQRLVFEGRQLDPAKDLEDYGIRDGSTLQLIILSRGKHSYSPRGDTSSLISTSPIPKLGWRSKFLF